MLGASRISKLRVIVISDVRASRVISDFDPSLFSDNDADSNLSNISPPGNMQMCIEKAVQQTISSNFR